MGRRQVSHTPSAPINDEHCISGYRKRGDGGRVPTVDKFLGDVPQN